MKDSKATTLERKDARGTRRGDADEPAAHQESPGVQPTGQPPQFPERPGGRSMLTAYKPEQGKYTRLGTFLAGGALAAWGSYFVYERLQVYQGDDWVSLLITTGIPLLFAAVFGALAWWVSFAQRGAGDFMIATEGEMKKVSWSSRREIIGSTKVVILFTILMAAYLFVVDLLFQKIFSAIGVLRG